MRPADAAPPAGAQLALLQRGVERFGEAAEIGGLICYLVSGASDFVTGATFVIDGGELSKL